MSVVGPWNKSGKTARQWYVLISVTAIFLSVIIPYTFGP